MQFIHQLRHEYKDKKLVIILDNASYHRGKHVKEQLKDFPEVTLKFLPTYSPEYNVVEQIWRWIKPLVHGSRQIIGGINEVISRLELICRHWREEILPKPLNVGHGIWDNLFIKIYEE